MPLLPANAAFRRRQGKYLRSSVRPSASLFLGPDDQQPTIEEQGGKQCSDAAAVPRPVFSHLNYARRGGTKEKFSKNGVTQFTSSRISTQAGWEQDGIVSRVSLTLRLTF